MEDDLISQRIKQLHRKRMERLGRPDNLETLRSNWRDTDSEGSQNEEEIASNRDNGVNVDFADEIEEPRGRKL
jgi:hypothetical protein